MPPPSDRWSDQERTRISGWAVMWIVGMAICTVVTIVALTVVFVGWVDGPPGH